jgi:hypothetical protein
MFRGEVIREDTEGVMAVQTGHMFLTADSVTTRDGRAVRSLFWKGLK